MLGEHAIDYGHLAAAAKVSLNNMMKILDNACQYQESAAGLGKITGLAITRAKQKQKKTSFKKEADGKRQETASLEKEAEDKNEEYSQAGGEEKWPSEERHRIEQAARRLAEEKAKRIAQEDKHSQSKPESRRDEADRLARNRLITQIKRKLPGKEVEVDAALAHMPDTLNELIDILSSGLQPIDYRSHFWKDPTGEEFVRQLNLLQWRGVTENDIDGSSQIGDNLKGKLDRLATIVAEHWNRPISQSSANARQTRLVRNRNSNDEGQRR